MKFYDRAALLTILLLTLFAGRCGKHDPPAAGEKAKGLVNQLRTLAPARLQIVTEKEVTFYPTYGYRQDNVWKIQLYGWAHKNREHLNRFVTKVVTLKDKCTGEQMQNFQSRTDDLEDDDKFLEKVIIKFDSDAEGQGYEFERSNRNGIVRMDLTLTDERAKQFLASQGSTNGWLTYRAVSAEHTGLGRIKLIEPEGVSLVTDIDDTIKVTEIPSGRDTVARNTFCLDFKAAEGMAERYKGLGDIPVHYISGGPQQLFGPLYDFLITGTGGFPEGTFHLNFYPKNVLERETVENLIHLGSGGPFSSTYKHKIEQITELMKNFPRRQFILVGDSGEVDPEVYREIRDKKRDQVKEIWIRDLINDSDPRANPYRFEGMTILKVSTVLCVEDKYFEKLSKEMRQRHPNREYRRPSCAN
jgi:Uncharacterized conserved protein (DUF2183)